MSDEEALIKTSFIDQLVQEKAERQKLFILANAKAKKDRRDLLCLASLERFLVKKLDFNGNMSDLRKLDERELENIKKLVLSDAKRKSLWSGLGILAGPLISLFPIGFISAFLLDISAGILIMTVFLPNFWFVTTGHYLGSYCKDCMKKRGTSRSCYCGGPYS